MEDVGRHCPPFGLMEAELELHALRTEEDRRAGMASTDSTGGRGLHLDYRTGKLRPGRELEGGQGGQGGQGRGTVRYVEVKGKVATEWTVRGRHPTRPDPISTYLVQDVAYSTVPTSICMYGQRVGRLDRAPSVRNRETPCQALSNLSLTRLSSAGDGHRPRDDTVGICHRWHGPGVGRTRRHPLVIRCAAVCPRRGFLVGGSSSFVTPRGRTTEIPTRRQPLAGWLATVPHRTVPYYTSSR